MSGAVSDALPPRPEWERALLRHAAHGVYDHVNCLVVPFSKAKELAAEREDEIERLRAALLRVHEQALEFSSPRNTNGTNATPEERAWFEGHALGWRQADEIAAPVLFNPEVKKT